jgi:hypothetical protein
MKVSKFEIIIGVLLFPIIVAVFFIDRVITIPMFWLDSYRMFFWLKEPGQILFSLLRCLTVAVAILIISFFL